MIILSVSASINIKLAMIDGKMISSTDIINRLLKCNWTLNGDGYISFLPLGDNDDYNWQNENISLEQFMNIILEKERQKSDYGNMLIKDLEEKQGILEVDLDSTYALPVWYSKVREKRISQLTNGDIARFIRQDLFLEYIIPEAIKRLREDPTIGDLYYGEVISSLYRVEQAFWIDNFNITSELLRILNDLNIGADFEWTYDGEEKVLTHSII